MDAPWFSGVAATYVALGCACAVIISIDEIRHPQHMWIMNLVWPVVALFGTAWIVWQYFRYGRLATRERVQVAMRLKEQPPNQRLTPFGIMVANAALHCGSGCTLGDICAEWLVFASPAVAVAFGWQTLFRERIFASWIVDYVLAYSFGIIFQYFTIAPMRGLPFGKGIMAAIKADTLSLTAWQIGMYGFMAIVHFVLFPGGSGTQLQPDRIEFWFLMQIAMLFGFFTSYPVNWWLLKIGLKERM